MSPNAEPGTADDMPPSPRARPGERIVSVLPDKGALMLAAAERIVALAAQAIAERGRFMWALAGGSTPKQLYELLATAEYASRIDWSRVQLFWGDERCVGPEHPQSNYRMARLSLLDVANPPASNLHRMQGELEPAVAAAAYELELRRAFGEATAPGVARFDLILLGMGSDGHTASLFPGGDALQEQQRWVSVSHTEELAKGTIATRLTLTLPVLNAARNVLFLVAGADKAARLAEVCSGQHPGAPFPAELVVPEAGSQWLVDNLAAAQLYTPA